MKIVIASDHAGFGFKRELVLWLQKQGHSVQDCGTHSEDSCDYPDFASKATETVQQKKGHMGILVCGTGIGMSMAANRKPGIRAALCTNAEMARLTREHNNANVLCMGARTTTIENAKAITKVFLETPFSQAQRHQKRIDKLG